MFRKMLFIMHCPLYEDSMGKSLSCVSLLGAALLHDLT